MGPKPERLDLRAKVILLLRVPEARDPAEYAAETESAREISRSTGLPVVILGPDEDLSALSEDEMRDVGWVRTDRRTRTTKGR